MATSVYFNRGFTRRYTFLTKILPQRVFECENTQTIPKMEGGTYFLEGVLIY